MQTRKKLGHTHITRSSPETFEAFDVKTRQYREKLDLELIFFFLRKFKILRISKVCGNFCGIRIAYCQCVTPSQNGKVPNQFACC